LLSFKPSKGEEKDGGGGGGGGGEVKEFLLGPSKDLSPRGNKLATKGSIFISGRISKQEEEMLRQKRAREEKRKREIAADASLQEARLEIELIKASGLSKTNMFGQGTDAYVAVHWLPPPPDEDDAGGVGTNKAPLHTPRGFYTEPTLKTSTAASSLSPVFDNEVCLLAKPEGCMLSACTVKLCVWGKGSLKDDFLGEVVIGGAALQALATKAAKDKEARRGDGGGAEATYELKKSPSMTEKEQKHVQGFLTVSIRLLALEIGGTDTNLPLTAGYKDVCVCVYAAEDLPRANTFGLSDPFCVLKWGSKEVGSTTTIKENLHPVWDEEEQMFTIRVPEWIGLSRKEQEKRRRLANEKAERKRLKEEARRQEEESLLKIGNSTSSFSASVTNTSTSNAQGGTLTSSSALFLGDGDNDSSPPPPPLMDLSLTVDVYDWNALGGGVFLGKSTLPYSLRKIKLRLTHSLSFSLSNTFT